MKYVDEEDLKRRGYREFTIPPGKEVASKFYQKRIPVGEDDYLYFDLFIYDFSDLGRPEIDEPYRLHIETQLRLQNGDAINIETCQWNGDDIIDRAEKFIKLAYLFTKTLQI